MANSALYKKLWSRLTIKLPLYVFVQTDKPTDLTLPVRQEVDLDVGIRPVPLEVNGGQVPALLDADVQAAAAEAVDEAKLDLTANGHRPVATLALAVHRGHRFRPAV